MSSGRSFHRRGAMAKKRLLLTTPFLGRGGSSGGPRLPERRVRAGTYQVRRLHTLYWGQAVVGLEHVGQSLELDPLVHGVLFISGTEPFKWEQ